jgi:hypothetical protein
VLARYKITATYNELHTHKTVGQCTNNSQNGLIYYITASVAVSFIVLESGIPQCLLAFGALVVDFPDPPLGVAYAAASPIE